MREPVWTQSPRPTPGATTALLGRWEPIGPADLTAHRRELATALSGGSRPATVDEGAVERLLLVFEELASNALRHGRAPVVVELTTFDQFWLLTVSDAAGDRPPALAVGRDAARGGLGLYMVARLCGTYGWTTAGTRKQVWARIDYTRTDAPGWVPRTPGGPELDRPRLVGDPTAAGSDHPV